jgi:hydrogenase-4 component B
LALTLQRDSKRASAVGALGAAVGGSLGLVDVALRFLSATQDSLRFEWGFPGNSFYLEVDALSAFFLVVIFTVAIASAVFGAPYLRGHAAGRPLGAVWFHFNALVVSMALVVVARNGLLFLIGWESMALTSFFLVMFDGREAHVRRAGWTYLVASHFGTGCVLAFFAVLGAHAGSLDFDRIAAAAPLTPATSSLLFLLAIAGFGTKAGFVPLHVWLPEAHPAAPAHVSALMSGAMIKLGIYGILRALTLLGAAPAWWGWLLVAIGATSGVLGVLFALAQHDLKRLLAYHSVENIGIIALGLGVGLLGTTAGDPAVAFLGFSGALLHVLNHAVFKSLLFLGAGAVSTATHTLDLEHLGGLMRRMPRTGASFLVGSASISGLPPLNGFASEFLIFAGALAGATTLGPTYAIPLAACIGALALIGGLAAACFVKACGVAFLGEPRTASARDAHEVGSLMVAPQVALAALCVALGVGAPLVVPLLLPSASPLLGTALGGASQAAAFAAGALASVSVAFALVLGLALALALLRRGLGARAPIQAGPTWDCGFASPSPRMQYTASSFAAPLTQYFRNLMRTRADVVAPSGPFPGRASLETESPDFFLEGGFETAFLGARRALSGVLRLQNGRVQFYVLYLVATLIGLLIWRLI